MMHGGKFRGWLAALTCMLVVLVFGSGPYPAIVTANAAHNELEILNDQDDFMSDTRSQDGQQEIETENDVGGRIPPQSLSAVPIGGHQVFLKWEQAAHAERAVQYLVYRNGDQIGSTVRMSFADKNAPGEHDQAAVYQVRAVYPDGKLSKASAPVPAKGQALGTAIPPSTGNWDSVRTTLVDYSNVIDCSRYLDYDVVIMSSFVSVDEIKAIKKLHPEIFLIAYISVAQDGMYYDAEGKPRDFYFTYPNGEPVKDPNWPSYYIDARKPEWQKFVLEERLPQLFGKGFDGAFLDTVDVSAVVDYPSPGLDFRPSAPGMAELIRKIKQNYPDKKIVPNGGLHIIDGIQSSIDGMMAESFTATWAGETLPDGSNAEDYHIYPLGSPIAAYQKSKVDMINRHRFRFETDSSGKVNYERPLRDALGKPVKSDHYFHLFALDYLKKDQKEMMQYAVDAAWSLGLLPSISDKFLTQSEYDWPAMTRLPDDDRFGSAIGAAARPLRMKLDADLKDWETVPIELSGSKWRLKFYGEAMNNYLTDKPNLWISAQSDDVWSGNLHIVLDSDNNPGTGWHSAIWRQTTGFDYRLEENKLYRYTGDGKSWSWTLMGEVPLAKGEKTAEWSIPIAKPFAESGQSLYLHPRSTLTVGAVVYDGGKTFDLAPNRRLPLPAVRLNALIPLPDANQPDPGSGDPGVIPPPINFALDGLGEDWAAVPYSLDHGGLNMKLSGQSADPAAGKPDTLWILAESERAWQGSVRVVLDTDNNPETGYSFYHWSSQSGAEYIIEDGYLFRYTGDGTSWSWEPIGSVPFRVTDRFAEWSVPLGTTFPESGAQLNVDPHGYITVGSMEYLVADTLAQAPDAQEPLVRVDLDARQ